MHTENLNTKKVRLISLLSFIIGFLDAFFIYVLSTYFSVLSGSVNVGVFYFIGYAAVLFALFSLQPLIRVIGRARTLSLSLVLSICAAGILATTTLPFLGIGAALLLILATNVTWVMLDILLEGFSQDRVSGSIRGTYLTIMNAGLLIAPLLSLRTLDAFSYQGIFLTLTMGYTLVFLLALIGFRNDNQVTQKRLRPWFTIKKVIRTPNLWHIYHVSFAMEFFYALMIVYTPIYLRTLGFAWSEIGAIFTVMLIPFVILQYPLGVLADRYFGEKEMLIGSIALAAAATLMIPFMESGSLVAWGVVLFMTRVGIAGIEILRDSYFYKQVDAGDVDIIALFRTARPIANIVAAILSLIFLVFFPLSSIFYIIALVLFLGLVSTCFLHDTVPSGRRSRAMAA